MTRIDAISLVLYCAVFFGGAHVLHAATFINDSDTIDIEYIGGTEQSGGGFKVFAPPPPPPPDSDPLILVLDDDDDTDALPVIETIEVTTTPEGSDDSDGGTSTATTETVRAEEIIEILTTAQTFEVFKNSSNEVGVRFFGGKLRDALRAQGIHRITLPTDFFFNLTSREGSAVKRLTQSDFALVVADVSLRDEFVDEVTIVRNTLTVRYKALGRLFGFIPLRYPLTTTVVLSSSTTGVTFTFPWYSFFLAKGISEKELKLKMSLALTELMKDGDGTYDLGTRAFKAVSDVLLLELGGD